MSLLTKNKTKENALLKQKREWGTETDCTPLPYLHDIPSSRKIAMSRLAVVLTLFFWIAYVVSVMFRQLLESQKTYTLTTHAFSYLVIVTFLTLSSLIYLITRQGAFLRFSRHVRTSRYLLDKYFAKSKPSITVLVPSYAEEPEVIRKTLMSAALQEYPNIKVVLLIDDDEKKVQGEKLEKLRKTQAIGKEIETLLAEPYEYFSNELASAEKRIKGKSNVSGGELRKIAKQYGWASDWLRKQAAKEIVSDHVDVFFRDQVLNKLADDLDQVRLALIESDKENASLPKDRALQLYERLIWIFGTRVEKFERKKYISLSHEPNKAMNINSYIGLMGGTYRQEATSEGIVLSKDDTGDFIVPDSEFILTLDADSVLLQEYCLRLVYFLQQPDNADVAVTQTPYSSFRGAPTRLERIAGATTDVQHILHQGMTYYDATFWVGANAVIRKKALMDIEETEWIGGYEVKRYVQDNTVIEDTESSIDLILKGWRLVNYPERLSYSATPPDFGSLVVQRRRWANGGLLILPKLWNKKKGYNMEFLIRMNYMASIAWSNIGLTLLLAYPYDGRLLSPLVILAAIPYFMAQASDLKYCRYSYGDIFSIYGFNLILLPVNIAGVFKSLNQALTTKKIAFGRTPKVQSRTVSDLPYIIAPLLILGFSVFTLWHSYQKGNWGNAAYAGFNTIAIVWAIVAFIGVRNLFVDIYIGVKNWLYVDVSDSKTAKGVEMGPVPDWQIILNHGNVGSTKAYSSSSSLTLNSKRNN